MPTDRPRTKSAMRTWLAKEQLKAAGFVMPSRTGRACIRHRLWMRYIVALDMLAQTLGIDCNQAARNVEYRLACVDRGQQRPKVHHSKFTQRALRDKNSQAVCPVCGSVLDLDSRTWTENPDAEALEPLDLDDEAQENPQE